MRGFINKKNFFSNTENKFSPYIILEAGINHEGSLEKAKKLIDHASLSGANAVKFQYFELDDFYLKGSEGYKNLEKMYLNKQSIIRLRKYAEKNKITFLCTAYFEKSFDFLEYDVNVSAHKISSMDNNNFDLIKHVARFNKPLIISTGMGTIENLSKIKKLINKHHNKIYFLHCISNYPTEPKDLNLVNIKYLQKKLNTPIGFSDHSQNIYAMMNSLNYNPVIIEKHFTFDKKRVGFDHNISADKYDIQQFYKYLNFFKLSRGKEFIGKTKRPDQKNQKIFRKGIYYKKNLMKGEQISIQEVHKARPGKNFQLLNIFSNKKKYILKRSVKKYQKITMKDI